MLVVPFACDQPDNALRLARLGIARRLAKNSYTARRASRDIGLLLNNPGYRTKAEQIARIVESENGVCIACDELEKWLGKVA